MPRSNRLLVLVTLLLAAPGLAWGQDRAVQFTIANTYPGLSGRLGAWGRLYVKLAYRSDRPVRFRMEGFAAVQKVTSASSNIAPPYPAGDGEAMVWIAYAQPTTIDEIRIWAFDEKWQPLASVTAPAPLEWSAAAARNTRPRPEWAERLNNEQQESARKRDAKDSAEHMAFGMVVVGIGGFSILGYLVLQPFLAFRFFGGLAYCCTRATDPHGAAVHRYSLLVEGGLKPVASISHHVYALSLSLSPDHRSDALGGGPTGTFVTRHLCWGKSNRVSVGRVGPDGGVARRTACPTKGALPGRRCRS
jgi:hypothetical protein